MNNSRAPYVLISQQGTRGKTLYTLISLNKGVLGVDTSARAPLNINQLLLFFF